MDLLTELTPGMIHSLASSILLSISGKGLNVCRLAILGVSTSDADIFKCYPIRRIGNILV
jgi:hypothetical protein